MNVRQNFSFVLYQSLSYVLITSLSPWRQMWYLALIHARADIKKNASQTILISTATPSSHVYILRSSLQAKGMLSLFHSFIVQTSANRLCYCSLVRNAHTAEIVQNLYNGGFASTNNFNNKFEQLFVLKCIRFKLGWCWLPKRIPFTVLTLNRFTLQND